MNRKDAVELNQQLANGEVVAYRSRGTDYVEVHRNGMGLRIVSAPADPDVSVVIDTNDREIAIRLARVQLNNLIGRIIAADMNHVYRASTTITQLP